MIVMSQKKLFVFLLVISSVSILLHHGGRISWTIKALLGCPSLRPSRLLVASSKRTSIAFLKTHKTASTTVQNILFRFAERHNLTVALPIQACEHQFCYPRLFSAKYVHPHTPAPSIVANHMRFSASEVRRLMPPDTVYVTILREPAAMFESLFTYYSQHCFSFKRVPNGSLEAFLEAPWRYYRADEKYSMFARNTLTFDLGGESNHSPADEEYVRGLIAEVERVFSLVMIAEYFDESLVLLRHLLSWDLEDVLYVKLNMRGPGSRRSLSTGQAAQIRAWNALDARLYDHFNASLWRRLADLGPDCLAQEVRSLREAQDRLVKGCFGGRQPRLRPASQIQNKELRPWQPNAGVDIVGYDLIPNSSAMRPGAPPQDVCLRLMMPEVQYTKRLLYSQSQRYRQTIPARPPEFHPLTYHRLFLGPSLIQRSAVTQNRPRRDRRLSRRQQ